MTIPFQLRRRMNRYLCGLLAVLGLCIITPALRAEDATVAAESPAEGHSVGHRLLFYIPNRLFDVMDVFRLRVRVGPGIAAGVRATKVVNLYAGTYATVFVGLPGPRCEAGIPLPAGLESHNGAEVSLVDATADGGIGPDYSSTEIGLGGQFGIIGFDFGFDPVELLDVVTGLFLLDLRDDDL